MGTTTVTFIRFTTPTRTPTQLSRSSLSLLSSKTSISLLYLLIRNPNFKTKRTSLSSSPLMATPLQVNASSLGSISFSISQLRKWNNDNQVPSSFTFSNMFHNVLIFSCSLNESLDASSPGLVGANDLLIVGPGVLGRLVAEKWREEHPGCQIVGQTVTLDHHDELIKIGINPSLKETKATHKFPYVIFCAPPSRTPDYPGDVREAVLNWNGEGSFLFTSSSAPYNCNDNGQCYEDSPVVPIGRSPRTDVLLKAENVVLESGGCVVRLAGLYKEDRGAHAYWLEKGTVEVRPDHILNLIHYEDAASLSVAILMKKLRGKIFLGCDNHPLTRQEIMDLVSRSGKFNKRFEGFTGTSDPLGKKLNNVKTREEIGWEPKYPSFANFLGL